MEKVAGNRCFFILVQTKVFYEISVNFSLI